MLKSEKEKQTCAKYSARDADGFVHCCECPLAIDEHLLMCKANSHYDRHLGKWVPDEEGEGEE